VALHEIKRTSLLNVPQRLRELADEMEKRKDERFAVTVVIGYLDRGGKVAVRGFGERTSGLECSRWLARAQTMMTEGADIGGDNWGRPMADPPGCSPEAT